MNEIWKAIPGHEGFYEVSDHGNVRSETRTITDRIGRTRTLRSVTLSPFTVVYGHKRVNLSSPGTPQSSKYVHRLVLEAFVGTCPNGMEACHNNGNPADNRIENLRWDTKSANGHDRVLHGNHFHANKTHCPQGHPYSTENTYRSRNHRTNRECRRCAIRRATEWNRANSHRKTEQRKAQS